MKEAASRGHTLMQKLATRCVKSMAQRAAGMPDQHERNLLTEAARILMKHQEALCEAYPQALLAEFAQAIAGANARSSPLSFDSLGLSLNRIEGLFSEILGSATAARIMLSPPASPTVLFRVARGAITQERALISAPISLAALLKVLTGAFSKGFSETETDLGLSTGNTSAA